jgi:tight adherence protein B
VQPDAAQFQNALIILGAVLVFFLLAAGAVVFGSLRMGEMQRRAKRIESVIGGGGGRIAERRGKAADPRRRLVQNKLKELEAQQKKSKRSNVLQSEILQSGLSISVRQFLLICVVAGFGSVGLSLLLGFRPLGNTLLSAIAIGLTMGLGVPRWYLRFRARRRIKAFTLLFADAVDVIVRGIQSGLPVDECLNIIAQEAPDPVGYEFRLITEGQRLGLSYDEMLRRALDRVPTSELKFFAIVLSIQRQTGGNLAETLRNLSEVLRERQKLVSTVRAASSEARASAMIIGCMPFFVAALMFLVNRSYISLLFTDPLGNILMVAGAIIMTTGVLIMKKMVSFEV